MKSIYLKQRQSHPLEIKINMSLIRIREWYDYWLGQVYISFSGGKDSTVLLHLIRSIYPNIPAVFINTGLEAPEIVEFVKTISNVIILRPKKTFKEVLDKYGYPIISKEQSQYIEEYRNTKSEKLKDIRLNGKKNGFGKISNKWQFLINAPFKISKRCCKILKIYPILKYEKETNLKGYIGTMATDSRQRKQDYLKFGCNAFEVKRPLSALGFWREQDIWDYIKKYSLSYSKIYDKGWERTGCMFCMFGVHLEKEPNRFQRMKLSHPKLWDYCINKLNLKQILDYIKVPYHYSNIQEKLFL